MARNFKYFAGDIKRNQQAIASYIANEAPRHVGKIAVDHFKQNFDDQGFTDSTLQQWREVKRRMPPKRKGAAGERKILHGETSELFNSLAHRPETRRSVIYSDLVYAAVHNEGLKAGRGKGFKMPKRQFMGPSVKLDDKIHARFTRDLARIFKQQ
jgi:phage gpG-like protein